MKSTNWKQFLTILIPLVMLLGFSMDVWAESKSEGWGAVADTVTDSFGEIAKLVTAGSYLAGLAFSIGAIMKFKQHKDNPTQVPIGTPIALVFIAAALLFLPSILSATGSTLFGTTAQTASEKGCTPDKKGKCV